MTFSNIVPVDTYYYDVLNIPTNANHMIIKRAYKKHAIKYHPDKNKAPDAEEKFKAISEAFQVLSSNGLREKYDKHGRTPDLGKSNEPPNSDACYQCMYGGDSFKGIIGDMRIGKFFQQDDHYYTKGQTPPTRTEEERQQQVMEHAEQLQQERTLLLALLLKEKLLLYITERGQPSPPPQTATMTAFEKNMQQEIIQLKTESYGNVLLAVVGRVYTVKAKEYMGIKRSGSLPTLYYTMKEKKYITKELWRTVKASLEAQQVTDKTFEAEEQGQDNLAELEELCMMKIYQATWQMAKFEIEATLRKVCDDVLRDKSVDSMGMAEGLLALGDLYVTNAVISEVENEVVQLK